MNHLTSKYTENKHLILEMSSITYSGRIHLNLVAVPSSTTSMLARLTSTLLLSHRLQQVCWLDSSQPCCCPIGYNKYVGRIHLNLVAVPSATTSMMARITSTLLLSHRLQQVCWPDSSQPCCCPIGYNKNVGRIHLNLVAVPSATTRMVAVFTSTLLLSHRLQQVCWPYSPQHCCYPIGYNKYGGRIHLNLVAVPLATTRMVAVFTSTLLLSHRPQQVWWPYSPQPCCCPIGHNKYGGRIHLNLVAVPLATTRMVAVFTSTLLLSHRPQQVWWPYSPQPCCYPIGYNKNVGCIHLNLVAIPSATTRMVAIFTSTLLLSHRLQQECWPDSPQPSCYPIGYNKYDCHDRSLYKNKMLCKNWFGEQERYVQKSVIRAKNPGARKPMIIH